jgi:phage portal protein BeeE
MVGTTSLLDRFLFWAEGKLSTWISRRAFQRQVKGIGDRLFAHLLSPGAGYGWPGFPGGWSQDRVEQVLHYKHFVNVAVDVRADFMAGLLPHVAYVRGTKKADQLRSLYGSYYSEKSLHAIRPHEEVEPVDDDHPLMQLIHRPNEVYSWQELSYTLDMFCDLCGVGYLWAVPNKLGLPCELWVIPSHWVWPRYGKNRLIDHYEIRPWVGTGQVIFPADEVIQFKPRPSPVHLIDGSSVLQAISEEVDSFESVLRCLFMQFKNGIFPQGAIELDPERYTTDPDDDQIQRVQAQIETRLRAEGNSGRPIVLNPGMRLRPLSLAPREMAYPMTIDKLRDYILAGYHVPKEIAGIQDAGSEISMHGPMIQFCSFGIAPRLRCKSAAFTHGLARRFDESLRWWWDDPTPSVPEQINRNIDTDAKWGAITANEIRALRGRQPYRIGGNNPILPTSMAPYPMNEEEKSQPASVAAAAPNGDGQMTTNGDGDGQAVADYMSDWMRRRQAITSGNGHP